MTEQEPRKYGGGSFWHASPPGLDKLRQRQPVLCAAVESGAWGQVVTYHVACRGFFRDGHCARRSCQFFHAAPGQVVTGGRGIATIILGEGDTAVERTLRGQLQRMPSYKQAEWRNKFDGKRATLEAYLIKQADEQTRDKELLKTMGKVRAAAERSRARPIFELPKVLDAQSLLETCQAVSNQVAASSYLQLTDEMPILNEDVLSRKCRTFRSAVGKGELGIFDMERPPCNTNASRLQQLAREYAPVDRCHYWGCRHPQKNAEGDRSWVCPLCICHVFCSKECGRSAGHPAKSIQCVPHHGWEGEFWTGS